jgi:hypothetical protein
VLQTLDVLIGFLVVLLALSMAVTVVTQAITTVLNTRGRHLRRGLVDLLQQLDPTLTAELSKQVATSILSHPLVSGSNTPMAGTTGTGALARLRRALGGRRLGNVVHREEFTKLLMALAAGQGTSHLDAAAQQALASALTANGVSNPDEMLKNIRQLALQLERSSPELSNIARQNLAILHAAESDLVAKVNNWFDQTMDRTSQRFTASTRAITFVGAFVVAFALQVDTPALVNRLAADDQLRRQLVDYAQKVYETERTIALERVKTADTQPSGATLQTAAVAQTSASAGSAGSSQPLLTPEQEMAQRYRALLSTTGIITLPSAGLKEWWDGFQHVSFYGMLLTALLLSLGAPFWYNVLGRLLQLRSVLAAKDDAQRAERQFSETNSGSAAGAATKTSPALLVGERGDLNAIG